MVQIGVGLVGLVVERLAAKNARRAGCRLIARRTPAPATIRPELSRAPEAIAPAQPPGVYAFRV